MASCPSLAEVTVQAGVVDGRLGGDALHQRHQLTAQLGEQLAQRGGFHAQVREIDQRVGDVLVAGEEIGQAAGVVQDLLQVGLHGLEIILGAGLGPNGEGLRAELDHLAQEGRRHLQAALVVAAGDAHQGCVGVLEGQALGVGLQLVEQMADARVGGLLLRQACQQRRLAGAGGCAAARA